jgi:hypothetical protein
VTIGRAIPPGVRREIERERSAEQILAFLTITHPSLTDPIRVVSDPVDFVLDGVTFTGFEFEITIVTDDESAPFAKLSIQNVDRRIGEALQSVTNPATIRLELIAGSEFDQTADPRTEIVTGTAARTYVAEELELIGVEADAMFLTGRLQTRDYSKEIWPGQMATQENFPGLFR